MVFVSVELGNSRLFSVRAFVFTKLVKHIFVFVFQVSLYIRSSLRLHSYLILITILPEEEHHVFCNYDGSK